jgi:tight adherence protein B
MLWIVCGLIFVAAILAVESSYWLAFELKSKKKAINRRLTQSERSLGKSEVINVMRQERGMSVLNGSALNDFLLQTGLKVSKPALALWIAVASTVVAAPVSWFAPQLWMGAAAGLIGGPSLVYLYLTRTRSKRIDRFGAQFPEALDIIVRALRVGHPFGSASELVAREMPTPIGVEFGLTMDEIMFGQDTLTALSNLYRRVGQEDLLFLVIAVSVQSQTGGNLADVLARLSSLMRDRVNLRLKVKALSAEGRMSSYFLSAMPFVLFAAIQLMSKNYFEEVKGSAVLIPAIVYGAVSIVGSNFIIYKMVNFKV